jgi:Kef-type K+ transport system membrane component KefB
VLAILLGKYIVPYVYRMLRWMRTGEAAFAVAIGFAIAFAILAERLGLPAVIGAFIAGLLLRQTGKGLKTWDRVEGILSGVTMGFLAPIFFVLIGFTVDFNMVSEALPLLTAVVLVAVLGKIIGSYLPARAMGVKRNEALAIGSMMMGKGAMELVFARIALEQGIIGPDLFSLLVLMAFASTILAPIMFKMFYNKAVESGEIQLSPKPAIDTSIIEDA